MKFRFSTIDFVVAKSAKSAFKFSRAFPNTNSSANQNKNSPKLKLKIFHKFFAKSQIQASKNNNYFKFIHKKGLIPKSVQWLDFTCAHNNSSIAWSTSGHFEFATLKGGNQEPLRMVTIARQNQGITVSSTSNICHFEAV